MGRIYETKITDFSGGMTTVLRGGNANEARLIKHFDHYTKKNALIPYYNTESAEGGITQSNTKIQNFLLHGIKIYGLGVQTGTDLAVIYEHSSPNVGPTIWAASTGTQPTAQNTTTFMFDLFKKYKFSAKTTIYYGNAQGMGSYNIEDTIYNETANAISGVTSFASAIEHSKDGIFYFGYTTATACFIGRKNGASAFENTVLTIPTTNYKLVSICEYGNYIAIALQPLRAGLNSIVLLWDRDSSVATLSEAIDWGNNILYTIDNIDGYLIGVSLQPTTIGGISVFINTKLVFKKYGGGGAVQFKEISLGSASTIKGGQKFNNRLYFAFSGTSRIDKENNGTTNDWSGIWSVGRSGENESFSVNFDHAVDNSSLVNFNDGSNDRGNFLIIGDYIYTSYLVNTTYTLSKTGYAGSFHYSALSTYESKYLATVDSSITKKLIGVTLTFEKIPTSGEISLYYRIDGATAWTLIFTDSTANDTDHSAVNIESSGDNFDEYKEVEFQIISTGVTITGLFMKEEVIDKKKY